MNKLIVPRDFGISYIIGKDRVFFGCGIDINVHFATFSNDVAGACSINRSAETTVSKIFEIVGQKISCRNRKIVGKIG